VPHPPIAERKRFEVLRELGARVRRRRIRLGLSQETLAARADLHRNAIGNLERGDFDPKATTIARVAAALGVDAGSLLRGLRL